MSASVSISPNLSNRLPQGKSELNTEMFQKLREKDKTVTRLSTIYPECTSVRDLVDWNSFHCLKRQGIPVKEKTGPLTREKRICITA